MEFEDIVKKVKRESAKEELPKLKKQREDLSDFIKYLKMKLEVDRETIEKKEDELLELDKKIKYRLEDLSN